MKTFFLFLFILQIYIKCNTQLISCPKSSSGVFNLCFFDDDELIKTTAGDPYGHGYGVVLKVDSDSFEIVSTSQTVDDIKIVTLLINISDQVGIRHVISNTGNTTRTISVAVHADIQIYENDIDPIYKVEPMRGFKFSDNQYTLYLLFFQKYENRAAIDSIWFGPWYERFNYLWVNTSFSNITDDDIGITYSWQNYMLLPNEKINFTAAFTLNPDFDFNIIPDYIPTEKFTPSNTFSESFVFTYSDLFSFSSKFSNTLGFSDSNIFSKTTIFSPSKLFTDSIYFSSSNYFNKDQFAISDNFSQSQIFSYSDFLSKSQLFSKSKMFSLNKEFTKSQFFSKIETVSLTKTIDFNSNSNTPSKNQLFYTRGISYSISHSITYTRIRSVSFSQSYSLSNSYLFSFYKNEMTFFYTLTQTYTFNFFPYIIYSYSPSYTISYIYIFPKKKKITQEMLIIVISISTSAFFFVLYIIIQLIMNNNNNKNSSNEYNYLKVLKDPKKPNKQNNINECLTESSDISLDTLGFWF